VTVSAEAQVARARLFHAFHQRGRLLVLPNAWDVISARVFEHCGFPAVGTTSFGIARAHGLEDGQNAARECSRETVRRITAALAVPLTAATGVPVFVNARTDVFWLQVGHPQARLDAALQRAEAYLAAGADGIFIPGVSDAATIRDAVLAIGAPLNVLARPRTPPVRVLQELGVRRLSVGSGPMRATLGLLRSIAGELQGAGTYGYLDGAPPYDEANAL
jgi:2-methylisocitrate lyase-like PEP mutase family enzyme